MKRSGPLVRRTRLRPVSRKRRALFADRAVVRAIVIDRDGGCVAQTLIPDIVCGGPLDVHEVQPRSVNPHAWLDPDMCVTVCRAHHDWVGDHPIGAHRLGLHAFSWEPVDAT